MKPFSFARISVTAGLMVLLAVGAPVMAQAKDLAVDVEALERWQGAYDHLATMSPKWGSQGVEAFKATVDVGVPVVFVDVRTRNEWLEGIIEGALLINLNDLPKPERIADLPADKNSIIGVYCKSGHRSTLALTLLQQLGYRNAIGMAGGMTAWKKAGYPTVTPSPADCGPPQSIGGGSAPEANGDGCGE